MSEQDVVPASSAAPEVVADPVLVNPEVVDDPDSGQDLFDPRIAHRVQLVERGPFSVAVCSGCGWESFARRSRPLARREGLDHELLFQSVGR